MNDAQIRELQKLGLDIAWKGVDNCEIEDIAVVMNVYEDCLPDVRAEYEKIKNYSAKREAERAMDLFTIINLFEMLYTLANYKRSEEGWVVVRV